MTARFYHKQLETNADVVRVLHREHDQAWKEEVKLFAKDGYPNDKFDHSLAMGSSFLLVGTPSQVSELGPSTGAIYLYAE